MKTENFTESKCILIFSLLLAVFFQTAGAEVPLDGGYINTSSTLITRAYYDKGFYVRQKAFISADLLKYLTLELKIDGKWGSSNWGSLYVNNLYLKVPYFSIGRMALGERDNMILYYPSMEVIKLGETGTGFGGYLFAARLPDIKRKNFYDIDFYGGYFRVPVLSQYLDNYSFSDIQKRNYFSQTSLSGDVKLNDSLHYNLKCVVIKDLGWIFGYSLLLDYTTYFASVKKTKISFLYSELSSSPRPDIIYQDDDSPNGFVLNKNCLGEKFLKAGWRVFPWEEEGKFIMENGIDFYSFFGDSRNLTGNEYDYILKLTIGNNVIDFAAGYFSSLDKAEKSRLKARLGWEIKF